MSTLTPGMASQLALTAYRTELQAFNGQQLDRRFETTVGKHFEFGMPQGHIQGVSGGILSHLLHRTSGFGLIGKGTEHGDYKGDHVVAIRGTSSLRDAVTDLHCGLSGSAGGLLAHAGFNKTFATMVPSLDAYFSASSSEGGTVHCVGHSLGGALAGLTADWLKSKYPYHVNLYTFGSPRVGQEDFSKKTSNRVDQIFRCTHGADPVPMVPLFPFLHAPYNLREYRLDSAEGLSPAAHKMGITGNPGYLNTASGADWGKLGLRSDYSIEEIRLKYENRYQTGRTGKWVSRINSALITLLKDGGYNIGVLFQGSTTGGLTIYDILSRALVKMSQSSVKFADQTRGLIAHMLVFSGQSIVNIVDLNYQVIRHAFDKLTNTLATAVRHAISSNSD